MDSLLSRDELAVLLNVRTGDEPPHAALADAQGDRLQLAGQAAARALQSLVGRSYGLSAGRVLFCGWESLPTVAGFESGTRFLMVEVRLSAGAESAVYVITNSLTACRLDELTARHGVSATGGELYLTGWRQAAESMVSALWTALLPSASGVDPIIQRSARVRTWDAGSAPMVGSPPENAELVVFPVSLVHDIPGLILVAAPAATLRSLLGATDVPGRSTEAHEQRNDKLAVATPREIGDGQTGADYRAVGAVPLVITARLDLGVSSVADVATWRQGSKLPLAPSAAQSAVELLVNEYRLAQGRLVQQSDGSLCIQIEAFPQSTRMSR